MLTWLKRQLGFCKPTVADGVFTATICGVNRSWDPLRVWRRLEKAGGGPNWTDMLPPLSVQIVPDMPDKALEHIHMARQHSIETLANWVRIAFELRNFDEGGPTDTACVDLLVELFAFVNRMADHYRPFWTFKKRDAPSPSTPPDPPAA